MYRKRQNYILRTVLIVFLILTFRALKVDSCFVKKPSVYGIYIHNNVIILRSTSVFKKGWQYISMAIHLKKSPISYEALSHACCWFSLRDVYGDQPISHSLQYVSLLSLILPFQINICTRTYIIALILLAFTTRRIVRSVHLALSPKRFTTLFDFQL